MVIKTQSDKSRTAPAHLTYTDTSGKDSPCIVFPRNQPNCQVVDREIDNEKRIGNVCQQEGVEPLRLQVLHQEGGQHLDHHE